MLQLRGITKLIIHFLDKTTEAWWDKLFISEPTLDTTKLNCNRPIEDLPQDTQAMIRKMQWDNQQKLLGKIVDSSVLLYLNVVTLLLIIEIISNRKSNCKRTYATRDAEKSLEC